MDVSLPINCENRGWMHARRRGAPAVLLVHVARSRILGGRDRAQQDGPNGIAVYEAHVYWAASGIGATDGTINVAAK
jgi:hypothetical protein